MLTHFFCNFGVPGKNCILLAYRCNFSFPPRRYVLVSLQQTENTKTTTLVTYEDLDACEWIDKNLSEDSVVQSFPVRDGSAFYSIIPTRQL